MTLPTSGSISASQIRDEFGPTTESGEKVSLGEYRVEKNFGELSEIPLDAGMPQGNSPISFQDFRGKKLNIIIDYYTSTYTNNTRQAEGETLNIRDRYVSGTGVHVVGGYKSKPASSSETKIIVHVNRKLGGQKSTSANNCALRTGSGWENDTEMIIDIGNEGRIYGAGGDGGRGGDVDASGDAGQPGTSGLGIQLAGVEINVASGGIIKAGFGGGGGGGNGRQRDKGDDRRAGGGGGGGGQGFPAGAGGAAGNGNGGSAASSGTAGDLNESGEGGGGGNNANQAYGASGGEGGQFGENANNGGAAQHGAGAGGGNGAAIRRTTGGSFQLSKASGAEVDGSTTATGVS